MNNRVLLMTLSERTSAKGTAYMSGFLGKARVVAFKAKEPDKFGNEQWELFVSEPEPRGEVDQRQAPSPRYGTDWAGLYADQSQQRHAQRHATQRRARAVGEANRARPRPGLAPATAGWWGRGAAVVTCVFQMPKQPKGQLWPAGANRRASELWPRSLAHDWERHSPGSSPSTVKAIMDAFLHKPLYVATTRSIVSFSGRSRTTEEVSTSPFHTYTHVHAI